MHQESKDKLKVHHRYRSPNLKELAKCNRRQLRQTEQKLWKLLRNKFFSGIKFKRQVIIGKYIVDFVCFSKKLIIELDGGQHNEVVAIERDKERTVFLERIGYRVIRFWNNEINEHIDSCCKVIEAELKRQTPNPTLPLKGEGEKKKRI